MTHRWVTFFAGLVLALATGSALGAGSSITLRATTDREPNDFAVPKDASYEFSGEHAFDSGWIAGGSVTYTDPAFAGTSTTNVEGTVGYRARFSSVFSATATAGIGPPVKKIFNSEHMSMQFLNQLFVFFVYS